MCNFTLVRSQQVNVKICIWLCVSVALQMIWLSAKLYPIGLISTGICPMGRIANRIGGGIWIFHQQSSEMITLLPKTAFMFYFRFCTYSIIEVDHSGYCIILCDQLNFSVFPSPAHFFEHLNALAGRLVLKHRNLSTFTASLCFINLHTTICIKSLLFFEFVTVITWSA